MSDELVAVAQALLRAEADPGKAPAMAAYMKTDMAFYGVQATPRRAIVSELRRRFPPADRDEYRTQVQSLWALDHREEKYVAIALGRNSRYITFENVDLYERLIREGAWWDFVDEIAAHLIGGVLSAQREAMSNVLDRWIGDDDLWIRRSAILAQLRHGPATDEDMIFRYCLDCAAETDFFIRKAIGWALRQYAKTEPAAVAKFLEANRAALSPLSIREASKHLS